MRGDDAQSVIESLRAYMKAELLPETWTGPLESQEDLFRAGIMDSIAVFQIVNFVETSYGIRIENDEITVDNFRDLASIAQMVELKAS